jgi:hypothetical protein
MVLSYGSEIQETILPAVALIYRELMSIYFNHPPAQL